VYAWRKQTVGSDQNPAVNMDIDAVKSAKATSGQDASRMHVDNNAVPQEVRECRNANTRELRARTLLVDKIKAAAMKIPNVSATAPDDNPVARRCAAGACPIGNTNCILAV